MVVLAPHFMPYHGSGSSKSCLGVQCFALMVFMGTGKLQVPYHGSACLLVCPIHALLCPMVCPVGKLQVMFRGIVLCPTMVVLTPHALFIGVYWCLGKLQVMFRGTVFCPTMVVSCLGVQCFALPW